MLTGGGRCTLVLMQLPLLRLCVAHKACQRAGVAAGGTHAAECFADAPARGERGRQANACREFRVRTLLRCHIV